MKTSSAKVEVPSAKLGHMDCMDCVQPAEKPVNTCLATDTWHPDWEKLHGGKRAKKVVEK